MIVGIDGVITKIEPSYCVIKTLSGLSYGVIISLNSSANLVLDEKVEILTTHIVREDASLLYGFISKKEQRMFETLIKLNGIGPTTAMGICSSIKPDEFIGAIMQNDISLLTKIPGIGPKTAKRMIVELGDLKLEFDKIPTYEKEAIMALESLGFKKDKISKILPTCTSTDTASLIKEALKKLA
ncbi:MAG: Holliday junction branch migration protein RuvA [Campylobacter sp.]|nr:Holliday junction branch migration protein RuvA [Campylobacter sp.]